MNLWSDNHSNILKEMIFHWVGKCVIVQMTHDKCMDVSMTTVTLQVILGVFLSPTQSKPMCLLLHSWHMINNIPVWCLISNYTHNVLITNSNLKHNSHALIIWSLDLILRFLAFTLICYNNLLLVSLIVEIQYTKCTNTGHQIRQDCLDQWVTEDVLCADVLMNN